MQFTGTLSTATHFYDAAPVVDEAGERTWITRGANQIIVYSELESGAISASSDVVDEYFCLVYTGSVKITVDGEVHEVHSQSLCIIPPGASSIEATSDAALLRVYTPNNTELAQNSNNAETYAVHPEVVAPLNPLPMPADGYKFREYPIADYPRKEGVMGRIFVTRNLMINVFPEALKPRPLTNLSPHWHDDFEQISVTMKGDFQHHLRYPWTPNMGDWLPDEHHELASPAAVVIPATVTHTSHGVGDEPPFQIVDNFAPPRADWAAQEGWVRNASDYAVEVLNA